MFSGIGSRLRPRHNRKGIDDSPRVECAFFLDLLPYIFLLTSLQYKQAIISFVPLAVSSDCSLVKTLNEAPKTFLYIASLVTYKRWAVKLAA